MYKRPTLRIAWTNHEPPDCTAHDPPLAYLHQNNSVWTMPCSKTIGRHPTREKYVLHCTSVNISLDGWAFWAAHHMPPKKQNPMTGKPD